MRLRLFGAVAACLGVVVLCVGGAGLPLALENEDAFCAACHTQPEQTYYQQSIQSDPTTLAAFHAGKRTACIECHSGGGPFGRTVGLRQGAQDLAAFLSGRYHHPAVTLHPLGDDACLKCHANLQTGSQGGDAEMNGHYHRFLAQWQAVDPGAAHCTTCHTAHTLGLDGLLFMSQGKVALVCDSCHQALGGRPR